MRTIVHQNFRDYTVKREGFTPFMYCDQLNFVTTGIGNKIDNGPVNGFDISSAAMDPALKLPWRFKASGWTKNNPIAGALANQADIRASWIATKLKEQESPGFNKNGGFAYTNFTPLTLDNEGLTVLFDRTLADFNKTLAERFLGYEDWPADAQLAILSMSWAMGPHFNFPLFKAAVDREDFEAAIPHAFFKGGGSLEHPQDPNQPLSRNAAHVIMFQNAANVVKAGADRNRLFFPETSDSPGLLASKSGIGGKLIIGLEALALTGGLSAIGYSLYEMRNQRKRRRA